ncbi:hypothetical protein BDY21DRAFT_376902 [Lineolata rhizophorae]|uniref:SnoaL-like domain-containing protein n=1 Tax=Lineolata rhizophorae TaxID=578093 RepID=A0A6A6PB50_9PEZI|nr:hypothetical protein BDY21DRAFT_376902 [Lineolata rhizophorae]
MSLPGEHSKSEWVDGSNLTTIPELHSKLGMKPSHHHNPELIHEEEEILQHYKDWIAFNTKEFTNKSKGKDFYDLPDVMYFDMMKQTPRGHFGHHFDHIDPYYDDAHLAYKDLEIVATSKDSGYATAVQRYYGTGTDGREFSFTCRITSLLKKVEGRWKWVHEHVSFPVDLSTKMGDYTCGTGTSGKPA